MTDAKPFWQSKTLLFNLVAIVGSSLLSTAQVMPPEYAALAIAVGNLLLRLKTKQPVSLV